LGNRSISVISVGCEDNGPGVWV